MPDPSPTARCSQRRQLGMEHLWSRAVATGGNRWQMGRPRKRLTEAQNVAVGCHRLRPGPHGKEGVDGSRPSEGSAKTPAKRGFLVQVHLHGPQRCGGSGARYGAFRVEKCLCQERKRPHWARRGRLRASAVGSSNRYGKASTRAWRACSRSGRCVRVRTARPDWSRSSAIREPE